MISKSTGLSLLATQLQPEFSVLHCRAEETTFDLKEKVRFSDFCSAYGHSLLPYINKCLQALFPPTQLAQVLGVTVSDMQKMVKYQIFFMARL